MKKTKKLICALAIMTAITPILAIQTNVQAATMSTVAMAAIKPNAWANSMPFLSIGDRGDNVKVLQLCLDTWSRGNGNPFRLNVDGIFGPATRDAVKTLQGYNGLSKDGMVGPYTWAVLEQVWLDLHDGCH